MEMIIAVIVLAVATTVCFMNFVTLSKQINTAREENRAHWKSVEDSIDYQRNRILKEIQEGNTFIDNAFVALNENLTACKTELKKELNQHDKEEEERYIKVLEVVCDSREVINKNVDYIVKDYTGKVLAEVNKSTRDINFITKQQAGRVITTPLKVMWEQYK